MPSRERKSRSSASPSGRARPPGTAREARPLRRVPLAALKDDFSRYLRVAAREPIVVTRHGQPAGVLIGFASPDDWFDYRLAHDPAFQRRVAEAGSALVGPDRGVPPGAAAGPPAPPPPEG